MSNDELTSQIRDRVLAAFTEHERAIERDLLDRLGAPIFAQLMVEREQNPLGIVRLNGARTLADDTVESLTFRLHTRVGWMQTRPEPKALV